MMDLQKFEKLWPIRTELPQELQAELASKRQSCPDCEAFASGGDTIRNLLQDMGEERAADNFAYKMRVYASNHKGEELSHRMSERPGFRWGSLGLGVATGAAILFFSFGVPNSDIQNSSVTNLGDATGSEPEMQVADQDVATDLDESFAIQEDDSLNETKSRDTYNSSEWQMRTVSTGTTNE
ncbi:hypothetical protein K8I28_01430 [bacterium]|nr:hypothetical protein [bacterium]